MCCGQKYIVTAVPKCEGKRLGWEVEDGSKEQEDERGVDKLVGG